MILETVNGPGPEDTCPWRAFEHPVCADVINLYGFFESGQIELLIGKDPPAHLIAGLMVYHSSYTAACADRLDRARNQGAKKQGPQKKKGK